MVPSGEPAVLYDTTIPRLHPGRWQAVSSGQLVCQSEGFCAAPWVDVGFGPAGSGIIGAQASSGFHLAGLLP